MEIDNLAQRPAYRDVKVRLRRLLEEQAVACRDDRLRPNGELIRSVVDRNELRAQRVGSSMGWRWY